MTKDTSGVRRAELIAALSLALDLSVGETMERSFRSCVLAQRLGRALGLTSEQLAELYYVSLLKFLGCSSDHAVTAQVFGDELSLSPWIDPVMGESKLAFIAAMVKGHAASQPLPQRVKALATAFAGLPKIMHQSETHCEIAQRLASRMGFSENVCASLGDVFEYWNGSGDPRHIKGAQIALTARIHTVAEDTQLFYEIGGVDEAVAVATRRSGKTYDPAVVDAFCREARTILHGLEQQCSWSDVLEAEPEPRQVLTEDELDTCLEAIGDFCDLKSRYLFGHSAAVAKLAEEAGRLCHLPQSDVINLRRAGLVHEIGLVGVSSSILEKAQPLTESEWERMRLHSYYAERVLSRPEALAQLGTIACLHHERLDGSGYHKGLRADGQSVSARILAAACAYQTEIFEQPGRAPHSAAEAASNLRQECESGRLDGDALAAVLAAAGHEVSHSRSNYPAGLSAREIEVLRLLARGYVRKQIASELSIADKTVAHHIEHIYNKIGVGTRAGAALFGLQHGLLT